MKITLKYNYRSTDDFGASETIPNVNKINTFLPNKKTNCWFVYMEGKIEVKYKQIGSNLHFKLIEYI